MLNISVILKPKINPYSNNRECSKRQRKKENLFNGCKTIKKRSNNILKVDNIPLMN